MNVAKIVGKTVLFYVAVVIGATFLMYTMLWAAPGDVRDVLCPRGCDQEFRSQMAESWGLDLPLWQQYSRWLLKAAQLNFGRSVSMRQGAPVAELILPATYTTMVLVLGATFLTLILSLIFSASLGQRWWRRGMQVVRVPWMICSFAPLYILSYWVSIGSGRIPHWFVQHRWIAEKHLSYWKMIDFIPFGQQIDIDAGWIYKMIHIVVSMSLLAIGNNNLVDQMSSMRYELEHIQRQHFILAIRAKGASVTKHLLFHMLLPCIQFFSTRAVLLMGTVVIIETVMNISGMGWLLWQGMERRDTPVVLAVALFATLLSCMLRMISDVSLRIIDPRLRQKRN